MSRAEWELIKIARVRALADRLDEEALARATAAGFPHGDPGHFSYALGWIAHSAARRIVELEDARDVPTRGQGAAAPNPPTPPGGGVPPDLRVVYVSRESRK